MRRAALLVCAVAALSGCGPSLSGLVRDKHYREAICAAHDGSDDAKQTVARGLASDAGLYVHVHVVPSEELRPLLGEATGKVSAKARVARVRVQSNLLPVDALGIEAIITAPGGALAALPVRWDTLAWATSEKLPPRRTKIVENYVTGSNLLKATGAMFSFGFSLLFTDFTPELVEVDVTQEDYPIAMPLAAALRGSMPPSGCEELAGATPPGSPRVTGQRCDFYLLVNQRADLPATLTLRTSYVSVREKVAEHESPEEEAARRCVVESEASIPLGPLPGIEASAKKLFGNEMRPVAEVSTGAPTKPD